MIRTKADEVHIGDVVRRSYDGKVRGVEWTVTEVSDRRHQAYWGYWYRNLWAVSAKGVKTMLRTSDVMVIR